MVSDSLVRHLTPLAISVWLKININNQFLFTDELNAHFTVVLPNVVWVSDLLTLDITIKEPKRPYIYYVQTFFLMDLCTSERV